MARLDPGSTEALRLHIHYLVYRLHWPGTGRYADVIQTWEPLWGRSLEGLAQERKRS